MFCSSVSFGYESEMQFTNYINSMEFDPGGFNYAVGINSGIPYLISSGKKCSHLNHTVLKWSQKD